LSLLRGVVSPVHQGSINTFSLLPQLSLVFLARSNSLLNKANQQKVFAQELSGRVIGPAPEDTVKTKTKYQNP
jgi:hypothetical protein